MSVYVGVPKPETAIEITSVLTGAGELGALDVTGATLNGTPITPTDNPSYTFRTQGDTIKVTINVTTEVTALSIRYGWDGIEEPWGGDPASLSFMLSKQDGAVLDIRGANTIKTQNNWLAFSSINPITVGTYIIEITLDSGVPDCFEGLTDLSIQATYNIEGEGVARKVTKIYAGVDNVARKVKKGYVGVGGVARPFFSAEPGLEYYGVIDPLSVGRYFLTATTVGKYAVFAGGEGGVVGNESYKNTVDVYSNNLTKSNTTGLAAGRDNLAATTVGNYALFGGGYSYLSTDIYHTTVDAYNIDLVRSNPSSLSGDSANLSATTVGNYALFGGGKNSSSSSLATVNSYNPSLTRSSLTALSFGRTNLAATTVGNYALFGGGRQKITYLNTVEAYNGALTKTTATDLSVGRWYLAATTVGNYALFGGGGYPAQIDTVDAYNMSLVKSTSTVLSEQKTSLAATTVGNYALFGGGAGDNPSNKDTVDAYDFSLTRSKLRSLSVARKSLAATTVGNYALFGGGAAGGNKKDVVDAYVDSAGAEIPSHLSIDGGEGDYDLLDLIDGTITKIARNYSDFITLKRGHAYRFALSDPDSSMWKKIKNIDANVTSELGVTDYEYKGAIGYDRDTIYIAPNISVPTDAGDPEDRLILTIAVYFNIV